MENRKVKIAYFHPSSSITAGSTQSLVRLVEQINIKNFHPIVILSRRGNVEDVLKQNSIKYYVVNDYANNYWTLTDETNTASIKFIVEYIIKTVLNWIQIIQATRICKKEKIDIVHINTMTCCQGAYVAKRLRKPLVWHIREFMEEDLGVKFYKSENAKKLINSADCIIAISNTVGDKFNSFLGGKLVRTIYNGVSIDKYYAKREIFKDLSKVVISINGRVNRKKGQHELLLALSHLDNNIKKHVHCNIIGELLDEEYGKYLNQIVIENGLEKMVNFIGFTKHVEHYLLNTDILCVCSVKEAFGRVTVEGMQAGCLVIGANSGGTAELICDNETGMLYESKNVKSLACCIENAITNFEESRKMARLGQKISLERFTDKINMENIKRVYEEVLDK